MLLFTFRIVRKRPFYGKRDRFGLVLGGNGEHSPQLEQVKWRYLTNIKDLLEVAAMQRMVTQGVQIMTGLIAICGEDTTVWRRGQGRPQR